MMKRKNTLNHQQMFLLTKLLHDNQDSLKAYRNRDGIAKWASTELGFTVTESNVEAALSAASIDFKGQRGYRAKSANVNRDLAREIIFLYRELDLPISDRLLHISGRTDSSAQEHDE